mmetsp:Transcript_33925/g.107768  ORF Transcript_33925/g.107768 Transcript_33925/m.107768 type:complete len:231 (-) Transcript_33925:1145-1837(-)
MEQTVEHGDQLLQGSKTQSWSHERPLQGRVSCTVSHSRPPCRALVMMARVFDWTPPSHSFVHLDQLDHWDSSQSTGHFCWLHLLFLCKGGHCTPYWLGLWLISRLRTWVPPHLYASSCTQESSQVRRCPLAPVHWEATQSVTSQSRISEGGELLLWIMSLLLMHLTATMLVHKMSETLLWHSRLASQCERSRSLCSSSFSSISSTSMFICAVASAKLCSFVAFKLLITVS